MAAVVGPVGIYHSDLGHGRVTVLGFEIILTKRYIVRVHRETVFFHKFLKRRAVKTYKAVKCGDRIRYVVFNSKRFGLFE